MLLLLHPNPHPRPSLGEVVSVVAARQRFAISMSEPVFVGNFAGVFASKGFFVALVGSMDRGSDVWCGEARA